MNGPAGVAVAPSTGNIIVADTGNSRLEVFNSSGSVLTLIGGKGSGQGQFANPEGVAVAANGDILVCDTGHNRIEVFNSSGGYLFDFGS